MNEDYPVALVGTLSPDQVTRVNSGCYLIMQREEVKQLYADGLSAGEIGKLYGVTKQSVLRWLHKMGVPIRPEYGERHRVPYNRNAFATIDSAEDAYWLGFLYADGSVDSKHGVRLAIHEKDKGHLESFCKYVNIGLNRIGTHREGMVYVALANRAVANNLIALGCVPAKSRILQPPLLSDSASIQAFILGYFDGDGSVWWQPDGRLRLSIASGSKPFLEWVTVMTQTIVPHSCKVRKDVGKLGSVFVLSFSGSKAIRLVRHWSSLETSCLERKRLIYAACL